MPYIDVLIKNSLGRVFTYHLPEIHSVGRYVKVPLRKKETVGIVLKEYDLEEAPSFQVKEAVLLDDGRRMDAVTFSLAEEIVRHAFCTYPEAVELFMYDLPKSERKLKERGNRSDSASQNRLSEEQLSAADEIWFSPKKRHLLYGITGSGKTEVYFELIRRCLEDGKTALFLLPEISLTPQMTGRIQRAFSGRRIAVIHSKITGAKRARDLCAIARGEIDIVLGARSAVLSPLRNIGIVIVDECHESSYLQENRPRYHAVEVAKRLAELENAKMVMGSATPDVSMYYAHAKDGSLVSLLRRYSDFELPTTVIADMRYERDLISGQLDRAIRDRLDKKEQTILLINRKGYSKSVQCNRCGYVFRCPNCDIAKTYYRSMRKICCNYCSHMESEPSQCPVCGNEDLDFSGVGTERMEQEILSRYEDARVTRIDRSVMTSNTRLTEMMEAFERGEIDILIGTQMIAKGLDFPRVTLVGILAADIQLYIPHFQSSERAFQLFTQVAGRAGRSGLRSEVIIQTYSPSHMAVANEGYFDFYKKELDFRRKTGYPPYRSLALMVFSDEREEKARESAYRAKRYLRKKIELALLEKNVRIFDEVPAVLKKLENHYRYQVLIAAENAVFDRVLTMVSRIEEKLKATTGSQMYVELHHS